MSLPPLTLYGEELKKELLWERPGQVSASTLPTASLREGELQCDLVCVITIPFCVVPGPYLTWPWMLLGEQASFALLRKEGWSVLQPSSSSFRQALPLGSMRWIPAEEE